MLVDAATPKERSSDFFETELPENNAILRSALYAGRCFLRLENRATSDLVADVLKLMEAELGPDPRRAQEWLSPEDFFARVGRIRRVIYEEPQFHEHVFRVVEAQGFDRKEVGFDPLRLRVVSHLGHENPRARPIYYPHRDTWFALSNSVIAWSVQLHQVPEAETFVIYPEWIDRPIANSSAAFDYDWWKEDRRSLKIGWQDRDAGRDVHYSGATEPFAPGMTLGFSGAPGTNVFFSGAHLHQTRAHAAGHTRFSLDFRMVHLPDHASNRGAVNVDNASRGNATRDYVRVD